MKHQTDLKYSMGYNTDIFRDPDKPKAYYQNSEWNNLNILALYHIGIKFLVSLLLIQGVDT